MLTTSKELQEYLNKLLDNYFKILDPKNANNLYSLVLSQIEPILIKNTLKQTKNNQSQTARTLGISRTTLRKLIEKYNL